MNTKQKSRKRKLFIRPAMGISGDMFISALVGFGLSPVDLTAVMERSAEALGGASVSAEKYFLSQDIPAFGLSIDLHDESPAIELDTARLAVRTALERENIRSPYDDFAFRALEILGAAEERAHIILDGNGHTSHHAHVHLHEAQDIVMDVIGAAWALERLSVNLETIFCIRPIRVGGGMIRFSHGTLPVPAPATTVILEEYTMPWQEGPRDFEQLTPTGAAILAALRPRFIEADGLPANPRRIGIGKGTTESTPPNILKLYIDGDVS